MEIAIAIIAVTVIGLVCSVMLVVASKYMAVKVDNRVAELREKLPGANCGACGYTGCDGYAKALADGSEKRTNLCVPGADTVSRDVANYLGVAFEDVVEKVAIIRCKGDCLNTSDKEEYHGIMSCAGAAQLHGGDGKCIYGCLGYGDCAAVCPNNAICIENGIAHVDTRKCSGCGMCASVCPHHVITVMADVEEVVVVCNNHDKGALTRAICKSGCIGCKKCEKNCPEGAITVKDNLAVIDYDKCENCFKCAENCPVGCIMISDLSGIHRAVINQN